MRSRASLRVVLACALQLAVAGVLPASAAPADRLISPADPAGAPAASNPVAPDSTSRWALVLSGGMARGFAHAGIIRALEETRTRPALIVGTSMGGIVGAMYAAGYSPDSLRAILRRIPWDVLFGGASRAVQWRGVWPRPWLELVSGPAWGLRAPPAIVDDAILDQVLVELFLNADAAAQGDFDRLPIPFRAIGTDVRTGRWHMFGSGSLARACRVTAGVPLLFPPVAIGDALLVDGGMSSSLPIGPARAAGAERVLAVDVALRFPRVDESSSGLTLFLQLWDVVNRHGQADTLSQAAGDTLLWLELRGASISDLGNGGRIIDAGYREGGAAASAWALRSGLPRTDRPLVAPAPVMPPLARVIEWSGRGPVRRVRAARRALGRLPEGEFRPTDMVPSLRRLTQSGLFESVWPALVDRGDSTVLSFDVRERPALAIGPAFRFATDEGASVHLGAAWRPFTAPLPALARLGWGVSPLEWGVHGSLEPHSLEYGSSGGFVRGRYHERRTRIFEDGEMVRHLRTNRFELFGGAQFALPGLQVVQAGMGVARISRPRIARNRLLVALHSRSLHGGERSVDAEWAAGSGGYSSVRAAFAVDLRRQAFVLTPGVRFAAVAGEPPPDALAGLGGPRSLPGLRRDEWLGRSAAAASLRFALEAGREARVYVAGQAGAVRDPVSGADLGPGVLGGAAIGAELELPMGPFLMEWGLDTTGRRRFDIQLGTRF